MSETFTASARTVTANRRAGFTLIELLVTIAVISILIALLLPAVQQAREAARRAQCRNNLKQLSLALHNYHDAHQAFPINYAIGPFDAGSQGMSWLQGILPYIEQANLYERIDPGLPLSHPANTRVAQTAVPVFLCPSDSGPANGVMDYRANVAGVWAVTNYKACSGSNWNWGSFAPVVSASGRFAGDPDGLDHGNGFLCRGYGRPVVTRIRDIRDGTSQTIALGEAVPEFSKHTWWWWFNATTATTAIRMNHIEIPASVEAGDGWWENYSFMSRHVGGIHVSMADGSGRFVSENINPGVYRALGTIQGGEVVGEY